MLKKTKITYQVLKVLTKQFPELLEVALHLCDKHDVDDIRQALNKESEGALIIFEEVDDFEAEMLAYVEPEGGMN